MPRERRPTHTEPEGKEKVQLTIIHVVPLVSLHYIRMYIYVFVALRDTTSLRE